MSTKLYDVNGHEITHHDLQDKPHWCIDGESKEQAFIRLHGEEIGYSMNPQKDSDPFAPDLISSTKVLADLKSQHTPFFVANSKFGIDPKYAVVFNVKDRQRYERDYPDIDIIYHIDWIVVKAEIYSKTYIVQPLKGIYKISFRELIGILDRSTVHEYRERKNDQNGNARESYVLDIREPNFERLL